MTPKEREQFYSWARKGLQESWIDIRKLTRTEAEAMVLSYVADFVKPERAAEFLKHYRARRNVPLECFRRVHEVSYFDDISRTARPRLPVDLVIQLHWPAGERVVAYEVRDTTINIGRLYPLGRPAIARYVGDRKVGWFLQRKYDVHYRVFTRRK